jgi:hypothetical protein
MNIVLDEAFEEKAGGEKVSIGMVVRNGSSCLLQAPTKRHPFRSSAETLLSCSRPLNG